MQKYLYHPDLQRSMRRRRLKSIQDNAILFGFFAFEIVVFVLMLVPDFRLNYGWFFAFPLITANLIFVAADWMQE